MSMAKIIRTLLIERDMTMTEMAEKLGTSVQNISGKLHRDNFSEKELQDIAKVCNATFSGSFILNDTGKEIK
ncbi:MAG: helix-turn-helix transcriptional regulator [Clostridia bacterium]|nr:helix-turn-helix transcriptional regulator [Clostridia bacterium]